MITLYHYTNGKALQGILRTGNIEPRVSLMVPSGRPAVWLTSRDEWEQTANVVVVHPDTLLPIPLSRADTARTCGGLARIRVPDEFPDFMRFGKLCRRALIERSHAKAIVRLGERLGSRPVDQWYGSLRPIPVAGLAIELFWLGAWRNVNDVDPNEAMVPASEAFL